MLRYDISPLDPEAHLFIVGITIPEPTADEQILTLPSWISGSYLIRDFAGCIQKEEAYIGETPVPIAKLDKHTWRVSTAGHQQGQDLFVYYQVTLGTAPRSHVFPDADVKANLWITLTPAVMNDGKQPISLITYPDTRFFHCNIKTLNLIPSVMASQAAKEAGCQEAVFYRPGGRVTECAHSNVHILKNGTLFTAPTDNLILPGIARAHLIASCRRLGIPADETPFTLEELFDADEVLVTSSSNLCMHADRIDGKQVGGKAPGLLESIRQDLYREFNEATA